MNIPYIATDGRPTPTPDFINMVRGELFKISRNRGIWVTSGILLLLFLLSQVGSIVTVIAIANSVSANNLPFRADTPEYLLQAVLGTVRSWVGIYLMAVAVIVVALEYQQGTIRVLLSRGVGRMRLLTAKLSAILLYGLAALVLTLMLSAATILVIFNVSGNEKMIAYLPNYFWVDSATYVLTILLSMVATIMLAATFAVLGRSLAFGLSFTLPYFLVETIVSTIMHGISYATETPWLDTITQFSLGRNINGIPMKLLAARPTISTPSGGALSASNPNAFAADVNFSIIVVIVYIIVFSVITYTVTHYRDIQN